jgi:hypothetical protein
MDRQQVLEQEVEFLRKLVTSQNEMIGKLLAERLAQALQPQPAPQVIPYPVPVPVPGLPPPLPYPPPFIPPMYPWEPTTPWWGRGPEIICQSDGCTMIPPSEPNCQVRNTIAEPNALFATRDSAVWQNASASSTLQ